MSPILLLKSIMNNPYGMQIAFKIFHAKLELRIRSL